MPTTKQDILTEIIRLAKANGVPPGATVFERETGIKKTDWFPRLWLRWGDAIDEAGLARNRFGIAFIEDAALLEQYARLAQRLKRLPLHGEIVRESQENSAFPSASTFRRFGGKNKLVAALANFCELDDSFSDLLAMCSGILPNTINAFINNDESDASAIGYVYLLQHGSKREFKIGRTKNAIRREGEINIELPHGVEPVHVIKTDDPAGIEIYWHRRFADKRLNGEW